MIRAVRPTDLLPLMQLNRRGLVNEARPWARTGGRRGTSLDLRTFLDQWLALDEHRHTWISINDRYIDGLLSARDRAGRTAWEIDRLMVPYDGRQYDICLSLLDYLSAVSAEVGISRVFLRLDCESPLLDVARQAGFYAYTQETLYCRAANASEWPGQADLPLALRRKTSADEQALFQLYCSAVPGKVRQAHAMTLDEWQATLERPRPGFHHEEWVVSCDGKIIAWLLTIVRRRVARLDLLVHPDYEGYLEGVLDHGLLRLAGMAEIRCLVPDYQPRLRRLLEERGFESASECFALVKQLAVRVRQRLLVPVRA